ncbi:SH3 domain-containing protein [Streptomyces sp. NPDC049881]|uniref:SH3 domain-containing protein n=1 Tax=Streptomyces sp. NPDC049881 TaxID=3155778 RepID=UPI00342A5AB3
MKSARTRLAAAVLPLAFTAATLVAAPTATAGETGAEACTHPSWSNKDSDTGRLKSSKREAPIHTGPNAGCPAITVLLQGDVIYYHCYVVNSAGNTWTHIRVRIDGSDFYGWVWDDYFNDNGSLIPC